MEVLIKIRDSGIFSREVVFNLLLGDQSDEERVYYAEKVNYPDVAAQYRSELVINEDVMRTFYDEA